MTPKRILLCTQHVFSTLGVGNPTPIDSVVTLHHLLIDLAGTTTFDFPKFEIHVIESDLRGKLNGQLWNSFLAGQNDKLDDLPNQPWDLIVIVEIRKDALHPVATCSKPCN